MIESDTMRMELNNARMDGMNRKKEISIFNLMDESIKNCLVDSFSFLFHLNSGVT